MKKDSGEKTEYGPNTWGICGGITSTLLTCVLATKALNKFHGIWSQMWRTQSPQKYLRKCWKKKNARHESIGHEIDPRGPVTNHFWVNIKSRCQKDKSRIHSLLSLSLKPYLSHKWEDLQMRDAKRWAAHTTPSHIYRHLVNYQNALTWSMQP